MGEVLSARADSPGRHTAVGAHGAVMPPAVAAGPAAASRVRDLALRAAGLAALAGLSLALRTGALGDSLWTDEGISAGIASHPLGEIPGLLARDGSPPLYYALLHAWAWAFGTGEPALRSLSLLFAIALVPAALLAGRAVFGERAGWMAAVLAATSSFLTTYAQEARMYTLVALLSLLATAALVQGLPGRRRGRLVAFAVLLALLLYTHVWGVFFALGAAAAALVLRARPADAALAFGVPALLYAPWLPTLLQQAEHTGAPWSNAPPLLALVQAAGLAAGGGLAARVLCDRRLLALAVLAAVALSSAWLAACLEPMWADRYLAILAGPLLLLAGAVLARAGSAGVAAAAVAAVAWAAAGGPGPKTNVAAAAAALRPALRAGDVVVAGQPELVPALHHYEDRALRYATPLGFVADPGSMDWRDALERLKRVRPRRDAARLVARLPAGARVVLVRPHVADGRRWRAPWTRLVRRRSAEWAAALGTDPRLRRLRTIPGPRRDTTMTAVTAVLWERTG